jgi:plastocyanin
MKRSITAAAALAAAAVAALPAQAAVHHPAKSQLLARVKVSASEFKFVLSSKSARRGVVTFNVTNVGAVQHDFWINGRKTPLLAHGKSNTLRVTFLRKGNYPYKCTVAGHAAAGMKGVFVIK